MENSIIFQDFHDHNTSESIKAAEDVVKDTLHVSLVTQNLLMYLCFGFLSWLWNDYWFKKKKKQSSRADVNKHRNTSRSKNIHWINE